MTIKRQEPTQSSRILGVYQSPMGDFTSHIQTMKTKADGYAGYLLSPRLTFSDIRTFHNVIYTPAMKYSLPAVAVDEEELSTIQSRIIPTIVKRLGLSSKIPTAIRFGPTTMGGLGLMDLRTESGVEMIKYFRHEIYGNTQVGQLLLLQVQASQLEAGITNPLLKEPTLLIPYLTSNWVLSMRQFMSNHNIRISLTQALDVSLAGLHDKCIMSLEHLKRYSTGQQIDINLVRIYLQVTTLSDMSDSADPNRIALWAITATRPQGFINKEFWPRQQVPSGSQRRLWRKYVSSIFLRYDRFWMRKPKGKDRVLRAPQAPLDADSDHESLEGGIPALITTLPRTKRRMLRHVHQVATDETVWKTCQRKKTSHHCLRRRSKRQQRHVWMDYPIR